VPLLVLLGLLLGDVLVRTRSPYWLITDAFTDLQTALGFSVPMGLGVLFSCGSLVLILALVLLPPRIPAVFSTLHIMLTVIFLGATTWLLVPWHVGDGRLALVIGVYRMILTAVVVLALIRSDCPGVMTRPMRASLAAIATLLIAVVSDSLIAPAQGSRDDKPSIAFLWPEPQSDSASDYDDASAGFGFHAVGLFGEWPHVLERAGYPVLRVMVLDQATLDRVRLLILPSVTRDWRQGEAERVGAWVRKGGRLLVVGEHTNLNGCQDVLNPVLQPFGLALNFDTTNGLLGDGLHGVITTLDPIGRVLDDTPSLPYNRGASISVYPPAYPILVGQFWHSDFGDRLARERANLSDYRLSARDRVGDLVMMASATPGRGRVLLVGDSTPFVNLNVLYSSGFILDVASLLTRVSSDWVLFQALAWLLAAPVGLLVFLFVRTDGHLRWLALGILAMTVVGVSLPRSSAASRWNGTGHLAVVSTSENNALDTDPFSPFSPTALGLAFARHDLTPWLGDWTALTTRPQVVAILSPSRAPRAHDWSRLIGWTREGTDVIVAADANSPVFGAIASRLGVSLTGRPVGSLSTELLTTFSAWEVSSCPQGAISIQAKDHTVGCIIDVDQGRVVLMADGGFFLSKNLETEESFDEKNIRYLDRLLTRREQLLTDEAPDF
jgi:hypothetical protein